MRSNQQNSCVPKKKEADQTEFEQFPISKSFVIWKMSLKSAVCSSSSFPTEAMVWISEREVNQEHERTKVVYFFFVTKASRLRGTRFKHSECSQEFVDG